MQRQDQLQPFSPISTPSQDLARAKRHSIILGFIFILIVAMLPPRQPTPSVPPATDSIPPAPTTIATPAPHLDSSAEKPKVEPPLVPIQPEFEPLPKPSGTTVRAALSHSTHSD